MFAPRDGAPGPAVVDTLPYQPTLFGGDDPQVDSSFSRLVRHELDADSWVEHVPAWLSGADHVFAHLVGTVPWRQRRVVMWDAEVDEPRLTWWWSDGDGPEPHPVLADARRAIGERYRQHIDSIGFNLYRDGEDSVAWHRDRVRHLSRPLVAILSVGSPRALQLRPHRAPSSPVAPGTPPRRSQRWMLGHGDLFVMGGLCQHTWEHCVPKAHHVAGPRMSITFRHGMESPEA